MNPFDSCPEQYSKFRPDYPAGLTDFISKMVNPDSGCVIDVGAGTGKASAPLSARGLKVISIEPSFPMILEGLNAFPGLRYVCATAEQLPIASDCAGMVTCAQAFHWLDAPSALREFARILQPHGHVCLFWNTRDLAYPAPALFEQLVHKWNPAHVMAYRRNDWGDRIADTGLFRKTEHQTFRQTIRMTIDDWVGLSRSISYIQSIGRDKIADFEKDLRQTLAALTKIDCVYATELWWAMK